MKYSIIVPIYNVEIFLEECLDSIIKTMTDECECILVNDGSTDNSLKIIEDYCKKYKGFNYYSKVNGGLSDARNYGLQYAIGEYVIFVDSDDVVSPVLIESVNKALGNEKVDVVYYNYLKFYNDFDLRLFECNTDNISIRYAGRDELAKMPNFAWARVAKRSFYEGNKFPVGVIYEDVYTSPFITQNSDVVAFIDLPLYGYRKRPGSITTISAEKQFELFKSVKLLSNRQKKGEIDFVLFSTALTNLSQSCMVSLVRINSASLRSKYRRLIKFEFDKISITDIAKSYSFLKFKCLSIALKNTVSLYLLEKILRVIVLYSDKRKR